MNEPPVGEPDIVPDPVEMGRGLIFIETREGLTLAGLGTKYCS